MMDTDQLRRTIWRAGGVFRDCRTCGNEFPAGLPGSRRADAAYCSEQCRWNFHNAKKRQFVLMCQADGVAQ